MCFVYGCWALRSYTYNYFVCQKRTAYIVHCDSSGADDSETGVVYVWPRVRVGVWMHAV